MFCREQVAQLRGVTDEIEGKGALLAVVGNGSVEQAARFSEERDLELPLFVDPDLVAFRAAGLRRDVGSTLRPGVLFSAARALAGGHVQGAVQGDPWQQGGAFVFGPGDRVYLARASRDAGDHADPKDLVAAIPG